MDLYLDLDLGDLFWMEVKLNTIGSISYAVSFSFSMDGEI